MSCDRRCFADPDAETEYECIHCPGRDEGHTGRVKVRIKAEQKVHYDQTVEMSLKTWEKMKLTPERTMEDEGMSPASEFIDFREVCYADDFDEITLDVVDDEGKEVSPTDYYNPA